MDERSRSRIELCHTYSLGTPMPCYNFQTLIWLWGFVSNGYDANVLTNFDKIVWTYHTMQHLLWRHMHPSQKKERKKRSSLVNYRILRKIKHSINLSIHHRGVESKWRGQKLLVDELGLALCERDTILQASKPKVWHLACKQTLDGWVWHSHGKKEDPPEVLLVY